MKNGRRFISILIAISFLFVFYPSHAKADDLTSNIQQKIQQGIAYFRSAAKNFRKALNDLNQKRKEAMQNIDDQRRKAREDSEEYKRKTQETKRSLEAARIAQKQHMKDLQDQLRTP
ncbi:MAG: hypothetical protein HQL24_01370 [Candidatus Omnitrophica bacterium]|nr:hypothetical protein [Candidatus Omnitrophota bacterium]